jgi:tripartite ATP-independent transporter DctM subunit
MPGAVANESLQEYLFAVVPLLVMMGPLVTGSGVGKDTFDVFQRLLRRATAGPGILPVLFFAATNVLLARTRPDMVFETTRDEAGFSDLSGLDIVRKSPPILALVLVVLGGLCGGFLDPTEAGAAGAAGALAIALLRRSPDGRSFRTPLVETGQITVSVLFLILAATLLSRMLALSGVPQELAHVFLEGPVGPWGFPILDLLLIIALGCIIESISIVLILLPIVLPVAEQAGFDLIRFGVLTVVAAEIGLLTPPFGLSVHTIRSAMDEPALRVGDIVRGTVPFVGAMLAGLLLIVLSPPVATWLARL